MTCDLPDTTVIGFFLRKDDPHQNNAADFARSLNRQLVRLLGLPTLDPSQDDRPDLLERLLRAVCARAARSGQRIVLVVDGLDEDAYHDNQKLAPIVARLPSAPPGNLKVIVSSRPNPELPDPAHLPEGHPVRSCVPHRVKQTPAIKDMQRVAKAEINSIKTTGGLADTILRLVTAAQGSGLTVPDLCELTKAAPLRVEHMMTQGATARVYATRTRPRWPGRPAPQPSYFMGHEALRVESLQGLKPKQKKKDREKLRAWFTLYQDQGWPDTTADYLLLDYPGVHLADQPEAVCDLILDQSFRNAVWNSDGNSSVIAELLAGAVTGLQQSEHPDLVRLAKLSHIRNQQTTSHIPDSLSATWARLGFTDYAMALARSLPADDASRALAAVVAVLTQTGDTEKALAAARAITDNKVRSKALAAVAKALAHTGHNDKATEAGHEALAAARAITDSEVRSKALAAVAEALAHTGHAEALATANEALTTAHAITDGWHRSEALAAVGEALARAGHPDQALDAAHAITDNRDRSKALADVAEALAHTGHTDKAAQAAREALDAAHAITDKDRKSVG
jgi:tetratricopeptide (TPR) repeat protein